MSDTTVLLMPSDEQKLKKFQVLNEYYRDVAARQWIVRHTFPLNALTKKFVTKWANSTQDSSRTDMTFAAVHLLAKKVAIKEKVKTEEEKEEVITTGGNF
ncbi:hypothetical protein COOONC_19511 [Cooperia oncophora]